MTKIAELVEADVSLEGMGTTLTGVMFDGVELGLAHIGDSRGLSLSRRSAGTAYP